MTLAPMARWAHFLIVFPLIFRPQLFRFGLGQTIVGSSTTYLWNAFGGHSNMNASIYMPGRADRRLRSALASGSNLQPAMPHSAFSGQAPAVACW